MPGLCSQHPQHAGWMNPQGRGMRRSSRAGAKAEEPVAVAGWILCWEQPGKPSWDPRAWLPMYT